MIKKIIKAFSILFGLFILVVIYMSFIGIETNKFNKLIKKEISKENKKIEIELKATKILLNVKNLSINIKVVDPVVIFNTDRIELNQVKSEISITSFIKKNFSIANLFISTKDIGLDQIISIIRSYKNTPQLFILQKIIKEGELVADININFDEYGKIKKDFNISGYVKNAKLQLLQKKEINFLNFNFNLKNKEYLLKDIKTKFKGVKFTSKLIKIQNKDKNFFINGFFRNNQSDINPELLEIILNVKHKNLTKLTLSSDNIFSFSIDKKFNIRNLKLDSEVQLNELDYKIESSNLRKYLPNLEEKIKLNDHSIQFSIDKKKLELSGKGKILIKDKIDILEYKFVKKDDDLFFNSKIFLEKNLLLINSLKYKKEKNIQSILEIEGKYKKEKYIKVDKILLQENNNKFLIKGLVLNKKFKIDQIEEIQLNFLNKDKIDNKIYLKKDKKDYIIKGISFDASTLIDNILNDENNENSSLIFNNINSKLNISIDKTYLDNIIYIKNLRGKVDFKNNIIKKLNLDSSFPNEKKLTLTINTNKDDEKITTLFSDYPKSLVKRYKFIKGFEEGILDFYSVKKKNGDSKSRLIIDNFKVQEVPVLAKLLSLASLQGIADLLTGEGIRFTDLEMNFSNKKKLMTIDEMYAIGPAISILMDGYIEDQKLISLRGTLVPATTINRTIASIPLIGNILIGKKTGEGVFGVSFKIKGPPKDLKTSVNPVKTLTPRFITRTLEKIKKN